MSPEDLFTLKGVCIHEASHAAIARHYGYAADWKVFPFPTSDGEDFPLWQGFTKFYGNPRRKAERIISLAGCAAETLWMNPDSDASDLDSFIFAYGLTESDEAGARGYHFQDLETVVELVKNHMPAIEQDALLRVRMFVADVASISPINS